MTRYIAFCKIIEHGSFTKAAEALGYTQAAVSQMVRSLESEYSMTLLTRTRTGVRLTKEGEQLLPIIQKYVSVYRDLNDRVGEINGLESGELRIGTFSSMSQRLLPGLMSGFSALYPKINFVLSQGDNTSMPEAIKNGLLDFGFLYPEVAEGLETRIFAKDNFHAVVPLDHPFASLPSVSLELMAKESLILVEEGGVNTAVSAFTASGLQPRVKYRIHDDHTILSMVEKGLGVSILPAMILDRTAYNVKILPIETPVQRRIGISYQRYDLLTVTAKKFLSFMFENLPSYLPEKYLCK